MQKVSWSMKSIQEAAWSLHFWCIFVTRSDYPNCFASCSALAIVFWKSQNQPADGFWVAGRNAQVRWGEIWGGFVICRFEIGDLDFGFGSDTPCHVYDKGGGSLRAFRRAHPKNYENRSIFFEILEEGKLQKTVCFGRFQAMWLGANS